MFVSIILPPRPLICLDFLVTVWCFHFIYHRGCFSMEWLQESIHIRWLETRIHRCGEFGEKEIQVSWIGLRSFRSLNSIVTVWDLIVSASACINGAITHYDPLYGLGVCRRYLGPRSARSRHRPEDKWWPVEGEPWHKWKEYRHMLACGSMVEAWSMVAQSDWTWHGLKWQRKGVRIEKTL